MISRAGVSVMTVVFGAAVILSGLYRYFLEPGGIKGLWFGLVMGAVAVLGALLLRTRAVLPGLGLAALTALLVGGWFSYENFGEAKHELRMYLMILVSLVELGFLLLAWSRGAFRGRG